MAKFTDVNNGGIDGSACMFRFKETLKAAGWTVTQSSDGTTFNGSGDQITVEGSGAGGMANANAWFDIQDPVGGRTFSIQRGASNTVWRIKYSALDDFGVGTSTQVGAGTVGEEQIIFGSGTDASPTFSTLFAASSTFQWHVIAQSTATGPSGNEAYGFWAFATVDGTGVLRTMFFCEPTDPNSYPVLVGTRAAPNTGDPDPVIIECNANNSGGMMRLSQGTSLGWSDTSASNNKMFWYQYNNTNSGTEAWVQSHGAGVRQGDNSPAVTYFENLGSNPYDGGDDLFQIMVGRPSTGFATQVGLKGNTNFIKQQMSVGRAYPDTVNLATDAFVQVENCLVPWEDTTAPVL